MRKILACSILCGLAACGDDAAESGKVSTDVYGEDFIEKGIPASEMADGWAVNFDRFVVTVGDVVVGGVVMPAGDPVDLSLNTDGVGQPLTSASVPAGTHSGSSFVISRVDLAGSASKDGKTKTFAWVFDQPTAYSGCEAETKVTEGSTARFEVTVHADHLFYDSLVSEEPSVLFQALADADADDDGVVTRAELEATGIGGYDPGSAGGVDNLWTWLVSLSQTLGHVNGEGHCDAGVLTD